MGIKFKIVKRDGGQAITMYDYETEDVITTVTTADFMTYSTINHIVEEYEKMKAEAAEAQEEELV